ncbi:hypothetical protein COCVIDRAFT_17198 [Bipolaris victoriae FI3]|uniref:Uncharacterized protein n=1 Tax=Bipolaris victoriae (strain FI3) TaxID=930091 RepID=W7EFD9_BIPV3|nr:hypothetical protein COCVIDRAFT_17198 [Bipolaris victoriae FI3]
MAPPRTVKDRIPPILGWLAEYNTFEVLHKVISDNFGKNGMKLGLIRGPEYGNVDGGLIVNPPSDFPFKDLTAACEWLRQQKDNRTSQPLQIYRFDCKAGWSPPRAGQWVPFYMVTSHAFPQYICIVPMRSWRGIYRTLRRNTWDAVAHGQFQLSPNEALVFSDVLAPYAVHESDIYKALTRIINASLQKSTYVNPTNGVKYNGWVVPDPDKTADGLLTVLNWKHNASVDVIERLRGFMKGVPRMRLELNPVAPLVCDMFLYDEQDNVSYNIEHKSFSVDKGGLLSLPLDYLKPEYNWHFLLKQTGENLVIFTRSGQEDAVFMKTNPHPIDMSEEGSSEEFARIIRVNGPIAKARLREKWGNANVYDNSFELMSANKGEEPYENNANNHRNTVKVAQMGLVFQAKINKQCCNLRQHACILLHNHPSADAAILEHTWSIKDQELYRSSGLIPVSLTGSEMASKRCTLLAFIPHTISDTISSTSQYFELATNMGWSYPACTAQDFVFIVMTGGFQDPDQLPCLDTVVLMPSYQTTMLPEPRKCTTCENVDRARQWNWTKGRIQNHELGRASKGKAFSFPASPYLKPEAEPFKKLHTFDNDSVHSFFSDIFSTNKSELITTINGPSGLLQRQWNHGDMTLVDDSKSHPTYRFIQRILVGLTQTRTMQDLPFVTDFNKDYQTTLEKAEFRNPRSRKRYAMEIIVNESDRGITLRELIESLGFIAEDVKLCCDSCSKEGECKFLNPEIVYTLPDDDYVCGNCYRRQRVAPGPFPCTFANLPKEFLQRLRAFPELRAHVPCHECWTSGKICDNNSEICKSCAGANLRCVRIACEAFQEPRDNWFCPRDCDKAHFNDGYNNIVQHSRTREGFNALVAARQSALRRDTRTAICTECWMHSGDEKCTNAGICPPCKVRIEEGDRITCKRIKCISYTTCSVENCKFAHAAQNFSSNDLIDNKVFPRRLQGKPQYPYI